MSRLLRLRAPAKINWTLEVLGKRPDGYHEIRSVMQTIDLCDEIALAPAAAIALTIDGDAAQLAGEAPEANLAFRAAQLLRDRTGQRGGAHIQLTKRIPIAAGLGGGSSDAAAVLRGLRTLWDLDCADDELAAIAAELGSDVPFFLRGGLALISGRGDVVEPLPDAASRSLVISLPKRSSGSDKTTRMYGALRPEHDTDGTRTTRLVERLRRGEPLRDEDLCNMFEAVLWEVDPQGAAAFSRARELGGAPHLCGSGPAFFTLATGGTSTLSAADASRISEVG